MNTYFAKCPICGAQFEYFHPCSGLSHGKCKLEHYSFWHTISGRRIKVDDQELYCSFGLPQEEFEIRDNLVNVAIAAARSKWQLAHNIKIL